MELKLNYGAGTGAEVGAGYGAGTGAVTDKIRDLLCKESPPWQDLLRDFNGVRQVPGSNQFLSNDLVRRIDALSCTSSSQAHFRDKLEELWRQIGPWWPNNFNRRDRLKNFVCQFWIVEIKCRRWFQYVSDMLNVVREAEDLNAFSRDAWYLWKDLYDTWLDDLNYPIKFKFTDRVREIWFCEQERRVEENNKVNNEETYVQEVQQSECDDNYEDEGNAVSRGRFDDTGEPGASCHGGKEGSNQAGEEVPLPTLTPIMKPDFRHQEGDVNPGQAGREVPLPTLTPIMEPDIRHHEGEENPGQAGGGGPTPYSNAFQEV